MTIPLIQGHIQDGLKAMVLVFGDLDDPIFVCKTRKAIQSECSNVLSILLDYTAATYNFSTHK